MKITHIINKKKITFSFEFFPPKSNIDGLYKTINELSKLNPGFVSITYGAGGSTRNLTYDLTLKLQNESNLNVVSHLTCVATSKDNIKKILDKYSEQNIENILALKGDNPKDRDIPKADTTFEYAKDLVEFIKKNYPNICVGVAGFPEGHYKTPNRIKEMDYLKMKIDAGADFICTQLFFDNNVLYDFIERCRIVGINVPIIAGVMPITHKSSIKRMSELALGTNFPAKLIKSLNKAKDDSEVKKYGIEYTSKQVMDLVKNNVDGVHFYTLNKSDATIQIYKNLGNI